MLKYVRVALVFIKVTLTDSLKTIQCDCDRDYSENTL